MILIFAFLVIAPTCLAQSGPLMNGDVVQMLQGGFDEETVVSMIEARPTNFDTSVQGLMMLKDADVSQPVIRAMIKAGVAPTTTTTSGTPTDAGNSNGLPTDVGIYARKGGSLIEVNPEIVNLKTGGFLKSMATAGLTKGHVNGIVKGPHGPFRLDTPVEMYIVTSEGTSPVEYQLVQMVQKKNRREFRALTGGVIHASSGVKDKSLIIFNHEKVASRTYKISIPSLVPGEYGFLSPGAVNSASVSSVGKVYTFGTE